MTPQQFVSRLHATVVQAHMSTYRELFSDTAPGQAADPHWQLALSLFHALAPEQREVMLEIIRQVAIDTTADVLGVIDGVCPLDRGESDFCLFCGTQALGGDLQSLFLEEAEQH